MTIRFLTVVLFSFFIQLSFSQVKNEYEISFKNAAHHEAEVKATFRNLESGTISLRMSRTSPGRYALHGFAKNIYNVSITNSKGKSVTVTRPNAHQWDVTDHDGTINVSYTLFGNRGDGTYNQIDETHAILNMPATFMFAPTLKNRPISVKFNVRYDLNWEVATQLIPDGNYSYFAPNLDYFMDSPVLISDHKLREFRVESQGNEYKIIMALDHQGTDEEFDQYFANVEKIVKQQKEVFGDYPKFDYSQYIFLTSYRPRVSGDGMEHRNSTLLTSPTSLSEGGLSSNISTVAHEFFHAWNAERLRPRSLEPFDYEDANLSGELWFAEGFTSYYGHLTLLRAGIISEEEYLDRLTDTYNKVWNAAGRLYFGPIGMSQKAQFFDGARWVDEVNRVNTFISYYDYGHMLALALDLALRGEKDDLSLDGYMSLLWAKYGKGEIPYTIETLFLTLRDYAGKSLAESFFEDHIYGWEKPDYEKLFDHVGLELKGNPKAPYIGAEITFNESDIPVITSYTKKGSAAYEAGLEKGDVIVSVDGAALLDQDQLEAILGDLKPGKKLDVSYKRHGKTRLTTLKLGNNPFITIGDQKKVNDKAREARNSWLGPK
ncbi:M61 family metallopeptidase [Sungkyunkwania multivorans]|uniref:M61 family metallopeptidase n=1 Tax=Sungkyunkwania multivorans TaxID=1173618 RepID=A0ABW3CYS5_9FLAO